MHAPPAAGIVRGLAGAALLLALGACAGPASAPPPDTRLAADWPAHSQPLIHRGPGLKPGTTAWLVPNVLPRGSYRVISRNGDEARLIDGYRFDFDGSPGKEVRVQLPSTYGGVEALEEKYVVSR